MQTTNVKNIDNKHAEWGKVLEFYKDEINIFQKGLHEIAKKNTAKETMQMVEHFQNQFLIQSENIDMLQHDINEHAGLIAKEVMQHAGHINEEVMRAYFVLGERCDREVVIFKNLREEFMRFLSKLM